MSNANVDVGGVGGTTTTGGGVGVGVGVGFDKDNVDLHELSKGWKAAIARATDPVTRHEAQVKNDRGNLPLHSAASFRSPLEVTEALLEAFPEAAGMTNNYGNLALHFTAWKKGPLDVERLLLKVFPEGAAQKNNHGNLPLHYAAHYNAPIEVVEALYNAYPEGAHQKNNDSNTPLDLAIADGASPNVVALLQGKAIPPADDELLIQSKSRFERLEKELQSYMERHDVIHEDLSCVLELLCDVRDGHAHALYNAGIDPENVSDMESLLEEVRKAGEMGGGKNKIGATENGGGGGGGSGGSTAPGGGEGEELDSNGNIVQTGTSTTAAGGESPEEFLTPDDDYVERNLSKIVGLDTVKNQIRGLRRTIELHAQNKSRDRPLPPHFYFVGNPGTGKTFTARILGLILHKVGVVSNDSFVEVNRANLVEKTEFETIEKTKRFIEQAKGGVLFVDEAYTLLPSSSRRGLLGGALNPNPGITGRRNHDHGMVALRLIAECLQTADPLVILTGHQFDLPPLVTNHVMGFRNQFLCQVQFPNLTCYQIARIFIDKIRDRGLILDLGVTREYITELLENNTLEEWREERNGRIGELLLLAVRNTMKRRKVEATLMADDRSSSRKSVSVGVRAVLSPESQKPPVVSTEDLVVTVEDLQNAFVSGI